MNALHNFFKFLVFIEFRRRAKKINDQATKKSLLLATQTCFVTVKTRTGVINYKFIQTDSYNC